MANLPKGAFAVRVWARARQGWGSEDVYVALRHYGVTREYARTIVRKVEVTRILDRMRMRAKWEARKRRDQR